MARSASSSTLRRFRPILGAYALGFVIMVMVFSPFGFLVALGLIGGAVLALGMLLSRRFGSHPPTAVGQRFPGEHLPTDVINVSRIRIAGFGGLGMVVIAVVVALVLPRVGMVMAAGLGGGAIAALAVILYRRRHGPIASSDHGLPGARTVLVEVGDQRTAPERAESGDQGSGLDDKRPDRHVRERLLATPTLVAKT